MKYGAGCLIRQLQLGIVDEAGSLYSGVFLFLFASALTGGAC